jgi:serine/threonine protein kinase
MSLRLADLVARLEEFGLIQPDELKPVVQECPAGDAERQGEWLIRRLVAERRLTPFQAQQFLAGQGESLLLGNYLLLEKIGQGGMGAVYKSLHRRMQRLVAVKLLPPELVRDDLAVQRFHREVQAAARLTHPNIVAAFDADQAHGTHFLVMECVNGTDLSTLVKKRGPMRVDAAVDCILQAARGLAYAHAHGVIHRDIKPANLLLDEAGVVKILDMGLARVESEVVEASRADLTSTGTVMGTVDYMSPEQALNSKHADARSDQYSLGITLYYLLTGRTPYRGETVMEKLLAHRDSPIPSLLEVRPDVPIGVDGAFRRMVAKRPSERFPSLAECAAALEHCLRELAAAAEPAGGLDGDAPLQAFLAGLSSGTATIADLRTDADSDLCPPTLVNQPASDTGRPTLGDTFAAHSGMSLPRSASAVRRRTHRPWWGHPAVWLSGLAVVFLGVVMFVVHSLRREEAAAAPSAASAPGPTPPPVSQTRPLGPLEEQLAWALSHEGQVFVQRGGRQERVTSVEEWKKSPAPVESISFERALPMRDDDVQRLTRFAQLRSLSIPNCSLTDRALSHLSRLRNLEHLDLSGNPITDEALAYLDQLTQLRSLNLAQTDIQGRGLVRLTRLPNLASLNLSFVRCDGADLRPLALLPILSELYLTGCPRLTDECGEVLARTNLVTLHLNQTAIGDACLVKLADLTCLRSLAVSGTQCTGAGLVALAQAVPLQYLQCLNVSISAEEAHILRAALPEADCPSDVPIPPRLSALLPRIVPAEHQVRGQWQRRDVLQTPEPVPSETHLLKLPLPEPYAGRENYTVTLVPRRAATERRGGLGIVLPIGGRQTLLVMDEVDPPGWGLELIGGRGRTENGTSRDDPLTQIVDHLPQQVQITVQLLPSGSAAVQASFNGRVLIDVVVDPLEVSLPEAVQIPDWTGMALASRDQFVVEQIQVLPLPPLLPPAIGGRLVAGPWPDDQPIDIPPAVLLADPDWEWSPPENLGPRINNDVSQDVPRLSADGETLVLQEWSSQGRVLVHRRGSKAELFRPPVEITAPPESSITHPEVSDDGLLLIAVQQIATADERRQRLIQAERHSADASWGSWEPVFGADVEFTADQIFPVLSADKRTLYFSSNSAGSLGGYDVWQTHRSDPHGPWSTPEHAGEVLNSLGDDYPLELTPDGTVLLLASDRPGTTGQLDLWFTVREGGAPDWRPPVNLGTAVNTPAQEWSAALAADGRTLLFSSAGHGGYGSTDLWLTRRVPRSGTPAAERYPHLLPPPFPSLTFLGSGDEIEVPGWAYDPREPVTIEALVTPSGGASDPQCVLAWVGSRSFTIWRAGGRWGLARGTPAGPRVVQADFDVAVEQPLHVAATISGEKLQLFLDGRPANLFSTQLDLDSARAGLYLGGLPAGRSPAARISGFSGRLQALRIRRGIHYENAFRPPAELTVDGHTLAAYRADAFDGTLLRDLSPQERHGRRRSLPSLDCDGESPMDDRQQVCLGSPLFDGSSGVR